MSTIQLDADSTPGRMAAHIGRALRAYREATGEEPSRLLVHPETKPRVDVPAVRRILGNAVALEADGAIAVGTIRIKPGGGIHV